MLIICCCDEAYEAIQNTGMVDQRVPGGPGTLGKCKFCGRNVEASEPPKSSWHDIMSNDLPQEKP